MNVTGLRLTFIVFDDCNTYRLLRSLFLGLTSWNCVWLQFMAARSDNIERNYF